MKLASIFRNSIWDIFRRKKQRIGGRRKKTIATLLTDTVYKALKYNDRMRYMIAFRKLGYEDILEKNSPINLAREQLQLLALERAKEIIRNDSPLLDQYALREAFKVLDIELPPELTMGPKPRLTRAEKQAQDLEELKYRREYFKELKELKNMIVGDNSKGSGISRLLTPEVASQFLSMISGIIAPRQPGNGSPSSEPKIMVETPDGIVEMSSLEYQQYLVEKGLAGQAAPELKPGHDPQGLPGIQGNVESDPQSNQLTGAEEAPEPASLRVSEWAAWVGKDPAELVKHLTAKALEEDIEAQAALDFLQHCSLQKVVALLEANKGNTNDPAMEAAITMLLEHQEWLQAVIALIPQANGALGEGQG